MITVIPKMIWVAWIQEDYEIHFLLGEIPGNTAREDVRVDPELLKFIPKRLWENVENYVEVGSLKDFLDRGYKLEKHQKGYVEEDEDGYIK